MIPPIPNGIQQLYSPKPKKGKKQWLIYIIYPLKEIKRGEYQNLEINWGKFKILPPDTVVVVVVIVVVVVVVLQFSSQYAQV